MEDYIARRQPGSSSIRLLHMTDPHVRASADGMLRGINVANSLQAVCAAAVATDGPFDAALVTGDLVQDEVASPMPTGACARYWPDWICRCTASRVITTILR